MGETVTGEQRWIMLIKCTKLNCDVCSALMKISTENQRFLEMNIDEEIDGILKVSPVPRKNKFISLNSCTMVNIEDITSLYIAEDDSDDYPYQTKVLFKNRETLGINKYVYEALAIQALERLRIRLDPYLIEGYKDE